MPELDVFLFDFFQLFKLFPIEYRFYMGDIEIRFEDEMANNREKLFGTVE